MWVINFYSLGKEISRENTAICSLIGYSDLLNKVKRARVSQVLLEIFFLIMIDFLVPAIACQYQPKNK